MVTISMAAPLLPEEMAFDVALQADGRVLLAGVSSVEFLLARLTAGGELDTSFGGGDGLVTTNVAGGASDAVAYALEVGPDGRVTVVGEANYSFGVARYLMPAGLETRLYVQQDANFNVTSIVDVFGEVAERYEFLPYGERAVLTAGFVLKPGGSDFDFTRGHQGGQHDLITGLIHFRHREYSTALGRWVQQDPAGYVDGLNRYQALASSPVRRVDPSGTQASAPSTRAATGLEVIIEDLWRIDSAPDQAAADDKKVLDKVKQALPAGGDGKVIVQHLVPPFHQDRHGRDIRGQATLVAGVYLTAVLKNGCCDFTGSRIVLQPAIRVVAEDNNVRLRIPIQGGKPWFAPVVPTSTHERWHLYGTQELAEMLLKDRGVRLSPVYPGSVPVARERIDAIKDDLETLSRGVFPVNGKKYAPKTAKDCIATASNRVDFRLTGIEARGVIGAAGLFHDEAQYITKG